jgi:hypothetical protein
VHVRCSACWFKLAVDATDFKALYSICGAWMQRLIIGNIHSCSNGIYALISTVILHSSIQIQLKGALCSGFLSHVYIVCLYIPWFTVSQNRPPSTKMSRRRMAKSTSRTKVGFLLAFSFQFVRCILVFRILLFVNQGRHSPTELEGISF